MRLKIKKVTWLPLGVLRIRLLPFNLLILNDRCSFVSKVKAIAAAQSIWLQGRKVGWMRWYYRYCTRLDFQYESMICVYARKWVTLKQISSLVQLDTTMQLKRYSNKIVKAPRLVHLGLKRRNVWINLIEQAREIESSEESLNTQLIDIIDSYWLQEH